LRVVLSNSSVKWGGVHVVTEALARGLSARGHEAVVFGAPGSILEERMCGVVPFEPILTGMDLHPLTVWRAGRALKRHHTDVVLAMMKKDVRLTVPAARMLGIPSVVRYANDRPLTGWVYDRVIFGSLPSLHVANSSATRDTLLKSAPWLGEDRVVVIHNGVDPAPIDAADPVDLGLPDGSIVIGFTGRLETRKGLFDVMNAWPRVAAAVPGAHLVIVGRGPDEARARGMLGDSPRVHWLGYRSDVPGLLKAFDIAVVPSHWEGFGLVAAEAMLAGLPVVAANASSLPEIIGEHGVLVPPRDPESLAAALIGLARDPLLRREMGRRGRESVLARFGIDQMVDAFEGLLLGLGP
jgi:glycosyltransferase involved in cell wall biosynthesis